MPEQELIPHLFRTEYRKIVSVLCRRFGFEQIEIAEDIAGDTFLTAAETWGLKGIPPNPAAWLYKVAKNKAKNYLQRNSTFENKIIPELQKDSSGFFDQDSDLTRSGFNATAEPEEKEGGNEYDTEQEQPPRSPADGRGLKTSDFAYDARNRRGTIIVFH